MRTIVDLIKTLASYQKRKRISLAEAVRGLFISKAPEEDHEESYSPS
jgi:hypothetical protein